ncbi:hypothetical protein HAX54_048483 [Datura stramonium]|uniref:Uncharacterized protein n=1 Tax=Datura stramonium TaxID=4076 RepID=A0ABS8RSN0_DATST|nr:hypothetical protein [Datura stramonium]
MVGLRQAEKLTRQGPCKGTRSYQNPSSGPVVGIPTRTDNLHEPGSPASQPPVFLSPEQNHLPKDATDTVPSASSPSASPPCVASSPKWDGTPQKLRILSNLADEQESEENLDDEPLAWKVRKVSACAPETQSRDQVRSLHTRASAQKLMADALKESQARTAKRRKLKRRVVVDEEEVQPDVVVDEEGSDETLLAASVQDKAPLSKPKPKGKRKVVRPHKEKNKRRKPTPVASEDEVFEFFGVECGLGIVGSKKQMFTLSTLEECKCVMRRGGVKSQSLMSDLIASQEKYTAEIERLIALLVQKEAEIVRLKVHPVEEPGAVSALREENTALTGMLSQKEAEIVRLKANQAEETESLRAEVKDLTKKLLTAHETFNDRIFALLSTLSDPK